MHNDAAEPSSKPSTLNTATTLEIDTFCQHCHYNLHGQIVTIDERLGFPICRCPECGKFHPAGTRVTASSVWVRRFSTILLFIWVFVVLASVAGAAGIFLPLQGASIEAYSHIEETPSVGNRWREVYYLYPWNQQGTAEQNGIATMRWICTGSVLAGFIAGTLCVTLLWHWPRLRYLWMLLLPWIPTTILTMTFRATPEYEFIQSQCIKRLAFQAGMQCVGILLGVWLGRRVSRTLVRMTIPPKPRQALAFLWAVDGLQPR